MTLLLERGQIPSDLLEFFEPAECGECWVCQLVAVFRECRRILRPHGTLWVECGDSYASGPPGSIEGGALSKGGVRRHADVKPKDLIGAPWLLAFALRADGWYLRQCIIWHKPNAMPESVRDRCTTAHSYVFLFSKRPRYWFDSEAIAEPAAWERWGDQTTPKHNGTDTAAGWIPERTRDELRPPTEATRKSYHGQGVVGNHRGGGDRPGGFYPADAMKNARSVWTIPTSGFPGAHFATWPPALAERIILAGCPKAVCGTCGRPRERLTERCLAETTRPVPPNKGHNGGAFGERAANFTRDGYVPNRDVTRETVGWSDCGHGAFVPGVVLDPFGGAGTTALVARRLGRYVTLVELNPEYAEMARERLRTWYKRPEPPPEVVDGQLAFLE